MQQYKNLLLIGTSHISRESIKEVGETIRKIRPEIVALELDERRLKGLLTKEKGQISISLIKQVGIKGYIFARIGHYAEQNMGKYVGVSPGEEMITAYESAKEISAKISLIDQNIEVTLKRFSKAITWKEKFRFLKELIKAPFTKNKIEIDLSKVPEKEFIINMLKQVKEMYPNFYKVLITERNNYMSKKLFVLMKNFKSIVAVVGAGHELEIIEEIKKLEKSN